MSNHDAFLGWVHSAVQVGFWSCLGAAVVLWLLAKGIRYLEPRTGVVGQIMRERHGPTDYSGFERAWDMFLGMAVLFLLLDVFAGYAPPKYSIQSSLAIAATLRLFGSLMSTWQTNSRELETGFDGSRESSPGI